MEVLVSPTGTQVLVANTDASTGPLYYDYSEQFYREALCNQELQGIPLGFVHWIKAILEERATVKQAPMKVEVDVIQDIAELPASEVAELPASPVPKRVTRDLTLAAVNPTSSTRETIMDLVPARQMYSPRELRVEIDNLTIPSVGGLTRRLSEFLPSLKRFSNGEDKDMDNENDIMEHALEEINEVGGPALNSAQSSARLRPMPVTDDGLYEEMTHKHVLKSRRTCRFC